MPSITPDVVVTLREITSDNVNDILALSVHDS